MRACRAVEVVVSSDYYVIRHHVWVMFDGGLYSPLINKTFVTMAAKFNGVGEYVCACGYVMRTTGACR